MLHTAQLRLLARVRSPRVRYDVHDDEGVIVVSTFRCDLIPDNLPRRALVCRMYSDLDVSWEEELTTHTGRRRLTSRESIGDDPRNEQESSPSGLNETRLLWWTWCYRATVSKYKRSGKPNV